MRSLQRTRKAKRKQIFLFFVCRVFFHHFFYLNFSLTLPVQGGLGMLYKEMKRKAQLGDGHADFQTVLKQSYETTKMRLSIRRQLEEHESVDNYSYEYVSNSNEQRVS